MQPAAEIMREDVAYALGSVDSAAATAASALQIPVNPTVQLEDRVASFEKLMASLISENGTIDNILKDLRQTHNLANGIREELGCQTAAGAAPDGVASLELQPGVSDRAKGCIAVLSCKASARS